MTSAGGVVLCGGRSSRMGRPKAWLSVGGETMLYRVVRVVGAVVDPVVVVAAPGQDVPPLPAGVEVVRDEQEGLGPLGGLAAGLAALAGRVEVVYLSGCDVPLLREGFVRQVLAPLAPGGEWLHQNPPPVAVAPLPPPTSPARGEVKDPAALFTSPLAGEVGETQSSRVGGSAFISVPLIHARLHPLAAAYRTSILPVVRAHLAAGRLKMAALFDAVPTLTLPLAHFADVDPDLESVVNVNTPEDYAELIRTRAVQNGA